MADEMWQGGLIESLEKREEIKEQNRGMRAVPYHLDHAIFVLEDGQPVEATLLGLDMEQRATAMIQITTPQGVALDVRKRSEKPEPGKWYWLPEQLKLHEIDGDENTDEPLPEAARLMRKELREYAEILGWSDETLADRMIMAGLEPERQTEELPQPKHVQQQASALRFSGNSGNRRKRR